MKDDILGIAGITNECLYYYRRIAYLMKKLHSLDKSFLGLPCNSYEESKVYDRAMTEYVNKVSIIHLKAKPIFVQLILDINHIFSFDMFKNYKQTLSEGSFYRLVKGDKKEVLDYKRAMRFFRDALVHPEHEDAMPTPRALPNHPFINPSHIFQIHDLNDDIKFQIAEGKIRLRGDIGKTITNIKNTCLTADSENSLRGFKWYNS